MKDLELIEALLRDADSVDAIAYDGCWEVKETDRGKRLRAAAALIRAQAERVDVLEKALRNAEVIA